VIRRYVELSDDDILALDRDTLATEYRALRDHHAKETRILLDACERACRETDRCFICDEPPSQGHRGNCLRVLGRS
jgi:hypothetical protein